MQAMPFFVNLVSRHLRKPICKKVTFRPSAHGFPLFRRRPRSVSTGSRSYCIVGIQNKVIKPNHCRKVCAKSVACPCKLVKSWQYSIQRKLGIAAIFWV